jgi:hypothetical protein
MKILTGKLAILAALASACAWADNLTWINPNGQIWSQFYTSPYYALDNSTSPPQVLTIFCLDYNHEVAPPFSWQADLNSLNSSNLNKFQFGGSYPGALTPAFTGDSAYVGDPHAVSMASGSDAYHRYIEAAWLFTNILDAQASGDSNNMVISQVAAWDLFVDQNNIADLGGRINGTSGTWNFTDRVAGVPASINGLTFRDAVDEAVRAAQAAVLGGWTAPQWTVVTANYGWVQNSNNGTLVQEFLTPLSTPEPAAILLMGTVLALSMGFLRRRKKA